MISDTKKAITDLNRRSEGEIGKVTRGKFTLQNEPVFEGTRIPVSTVVRYLNAGYAPDAIVREFPDLTPTDIETASALAKGQDAA